MYSLSEEKDAAGSAVVVLKRTMPSGEQLTVMEPAKFENWVNAMHATGLDKCMSGLCGWYLHSRVLFRSNRCANLRHLQEIVLDGDSAGGHQVCVAEPRMRALRASANREETAGCAVASHHSARVRALLYAIEVRMRCLLAGPCTVFKLI